MPSDDPVAVEQPVEIENKSLSSENISTESIAVESKLSDETSADPSTKKPLEMTFEGPLYPPSVVSSEHLLPGDFFEVDRYNGLYILKPRLDVNDDMLKGFVNSAVDFLVSLIIYRINN